MMHEAPTRGRKARTRRGRWTTTGALLLFLTPACAITPLDAPRPVVFGSGARLGVDVQRLDAVHDWVLSLVENISCMVGNPRFGPPSAVGWEPPAPVIVGEVHLGYCLYPASVTAVPGPPGWGNDHLRHLQDPTIHLHTLPDTAHSYPWESLAIEGDTVRVRVPQAHPDLHTAYTVYAFLHLVDRQGRIEEWLPEAAGAEGFALERAIVERMTDTWLMGRSAFHLEPHQAMDGLLYASESGYLDAFLFTARPDDFPQERRRWIDDNPEGLERYREWFRSELGEEPPGPGARAGAGAP